MQHIVFFMNILMISLAVVPLVLLFARTQSLKGMGMLFQRLKVFLIILVLVALFNVVLCYDYEIADLHLDELAYQFGWELLCFLKVSACLAILCCICQNRIGDLFDKVNRYFLFIYGTAWVISTFIAPEHYWAVIEIFDNIVIALCLLGAVACLIALVQKTSRSRIAVLYAVLVAILNALSYSIDVVTLGPDIIANNLYIFTWIGIAVSTFLYLLYELNTQRKLPQAEDPKQPVFDFESAYDEIKKKYGLTLREEDILRELYLGKSNSQIAGDLNISEATVKAHIHNLLSKMDAASRVEVILTVQKKVMGTTTE